MSRPEGARASIRWRKARSARDEDLRRQLCAALVYGVEYGRQQKLLKNQAIISKKSDIGKQDVRPGGSQLPTSEIPEDGQAFW